MRRKLRLFAVLGLLTLAIACATMGGALIGGGIGSMSGNKKAGVAIGAGVGMMVDVMN